MPLASTWPAFEPTSSTTDVMTGMSTVATPTLMTNSALRAASVQPFISAALTLYWPLPSPLSVWLQLPDASAVTLPLRTLST